MTRARQEVNVPWWLRLLGAVIKIVLVVMFLDVVLGSRQRRF